MGNGYFKEITNEINSFVNPVKIAENIKDMACGDKFIAVIDNNSNIIVNGYFSLGTYITEQSTQYYENQLVKTESTEGNAMKIFACQTNIFVVFEDDACIAWGKTNQIK